MKDDKNKAPPSLDDLLGDDETGETLGLSKEARRDLARLDAQMRKSDTGEDRPRLDEGKPVRIVAFITEAHCHCGASYQYPSFHCAMLKRVFHGSTLRAIYSPLTSRNAFTNLPHETEKSTIHIYSCQACFSTPEQVTSAQPTISCVYCRGNHSLEDCRTHGYREYIEALKEEANPPQPYSIEEPINDNEPRE